MTSYDAYETSTESSRPIEIYTFAVGSSTFRYTSAEDELTVNGDTYSPKPISRSNISRSSEDRNRTLDITLPGNDAFASQYKEIVPSSKATVTITRLQRDETPTFDTQVLIYKGEVKSVTFPDDGRTSQLHCQGIESALNQNIPRFKFSGQCNHVLYDSGCGVDPASFDFIGEATAVSGRVLTVNNANSQADGYWTAGYATPVGSNDFRLILGHTGNDLTLLLPFGSDVTGTNIQVFAGCDHVLTGDCAPKFDNALEFGGFAFVPLRNPFQGGVV
jgi:uncharacterized phage protein (TIGR02218 family)